MLEIAKHIDDPEKLDELLHIFDERKDKPIDYRRNGVITIFVGIGLYFFGYIAIGFICLIIPGFIIGLMFSQIFYIMADDPETGVIDAFKKSVSLMKNKKLQYLGLILKYVLFFILGVFTFGIWWLWLIPQAYVSFAIFYKELKA